LPTPLAFFVNGGILSGRFSQLALENGYHYLSAAEVSEILTSENPALGRFKITGEGVKVFVQKKANLPSISDYATPDFGEKLSPPPPKLNPEESRYFFLIPKSFEGATTLKRGTSLVLALDSGNLSLQLHGTLVSDWNIGSRLRIKLQHSEKVIEESPSTDRILYF
jgi:hypothetical protein